MHMKVSTYHTIHNQTHTSYNCRSNTCSVFAETQQKNVPQFTLGHLELGQIVVRKDQREFLTGLDAIDQTAVLELLLLGWLIAYRFTLVAV